MIRLFLLALVSALLVACSDPVEKEGLEAKPAEEPKVEVKTEAEYIEEFKDVVGYDTLVAGTENSSVTPVDVDGDKVPEMVLIVNEDVFNVYVATFKLEDDEWVELDRKTYTSNLYVQLGFVDQLRYDDSSKAAFVISVEEAAAVDLFKDLDVFMYDEVSQQVKRAVSFKIAPAYNEMELLKDNQFSFEDLEGNLVSYQFKNGQFFDDEGGRLGEIIEDELAQLLGTTINEHYLTLNDTFEDAFDKISEKPDIQQNEMGATCAQYSTFHFCEYGIQEAISIYDMTPVNEVTVKDLEEYFGEPIYIHPWGDVALDGYYFAEVSTNDSMYGMRFDSDSPDAKLELFSFAPTEEYELYE